MPYGMKRRFYSTKPTPRNIQVKYAGTCLSCGARIEAGDFATYYPPNYFPYGMIKDADKGHLKHIENAAGDSLRCYAELKKRHAEQEQKAVNDYAGDGLDSRYEDNCSDICGR
jgi:hypothetical protein